MASTISLTPVGLLVALIAHSASASQAQDSEQLSAMILQKQAEIRIADTVILDHVLLPIVSSMKIVGSEGAVIDCQGRAGLRVREGGQLLLRGIEMRNCRSDQSGAAIDVSQGSLTVEDGVFVDNHALNGGAVAAVDSELTFRGVQFRNNKATEYGGAVYGRSAKVTLERVVFEGNSAGFTGGALGNWQGSVFVRRTAFNKNQAEVGAALASVNGQVDLVGPDIEFNGNESKFYGGAIQNEGADAAIRMSKVTANDNVASAGGFLFNKEGDVDIRNSTIRNNRALAAEGGAITQRGGRVTVLRTHFEGNRAHAHGGAIASAGRLSLLQGNSLVGNHAGTHGGAVASGRTDYIAGLTISDAVLRGNTAAQRGGGVLVASNANIINSALIENSADVGGGLRVELLAHPARVSVINSTIAENRARRGGAVYAVAASAEDAAFEMSNATVVFNQASETGDALYLDIDRCTLGNSAIYTDPTGRNSQLVIGKCDSEGGNLFGFAPAIDLHDADQTGSAMAPLNPLLGALSEDANGTPYYAPLAGSPLINRGRPSVALKRSGVELKTDQRGDGFPRIVDQFIDVGAIEYAEGQSANDE